MPEVIYYTPVAKNQGQSYSSRCFSIQAEIMEPSDYYDAPIDKVPHFIRSVGLIKG
jgi:hypothetical protein